MLLVASITIFSYQRRTKLLVRKPCWYSRVRFCILRSRLTTTVFLSNLGSTLLNFILYIDWLHLDTQPTAAYVGLAHKVCNFEFIVNFANHRVALLWCQGLVISVGLMVSLASSASIPSHEKKLFATQSQDYHGTVFINTNQVDAPWWICSSYFNAELIV